MGRKRGSRFKRASDAQEQLESIEKAQKKRRSKRVGPLIERIDKSAQRLDDALKRIKTPEERKDEFD
jgi:hypothetical protein